MPETLKRRVKKAAQRARLAMSAWVRLIIERALATNRPRGEGPLDRLNRVAAPTGDIFQMLAEIGAGRECGFRGSSGVTRIQMR